MSTRTLAPALTVVPNFPEDYRPPREAFVVFARILARVTADEQTERDLPTAEAA